MTEKKINKRTFTVRRTLGGAQNYRKWDDYTDGDFVIGEFCGIHVCQYEKNNYKVKVLDAYFQGDQDLATSLINKVLVLNSAGSLDKQMEEVQEGDTIQVTYNGKSVLQKGKFAGKEAHGMTVSIVDMGEDSAEEEEGL